MDGSLDRRRRQGGVSKSLELLEVLAIALAQLTLLNPRRAAKAIADLKRLEQPDPLWQAGAHADASFEVAPLKLPPNTTNILTSPL